jgi:CDP-glycerol glycerophosphotransferase
LGRFQNRSRLYEKAVKNLEYSTRVEQAAIDTHLVVFEAYQGRQYACSPKALYEFMLNHDEYDGYSFVWVFKRPQDYLFLQKKPRTKVVTYNSWEAVQCFRKAKYWIVNFRVPPTVVKMPSQVMVQCWHGTPYKKIGLDIESTRKGTVSSLDKISFDYKLDAEKYDYFLSPSAFASEKFISAFNLKELGKEEIILEEGYPRNDFLINHTEDDVRRIKQELHISLDKKVILYAPTWRDDQHALGRGYLYKPAIDFALLKKRLGDSYVVLYRTHYLISNSFDFSRFEGFVRDVSKIDDVNKIYVASDILITDYSSVFFDFANLKRPILFYMYDYENYRNNIRDFYLTLAELPGPVVEDVESLVEEVSALEGDFLSWQSKIDNFNKRFTYLDDGKASERVLNHVFGSKSQKDKGEKQRQI